jgi:competence protein ComEC
MGGMSAVLRDLRPRELWLSVEPGNSPGLQALLAQARAMNIPIRHLPRRRCLSLERRAGNGARARGRLQQPRRAGERRLAGAAARLCPAGVLLEGDAEAASEATMLAITVSRPTLLKVGHHGSKTSTNPDFLAAVAPQDAVISVGRHNTFGHPRAEVLARLEAAHIRTFRTDRAGAETFLLAPDGTISTASGVVSVIESRAAIVRPADHCREIPRCQSRKTHARD